MASKIRDNTKKTSLLGNIVKEVYKIINVEEYSQHFFMKNLWVNNGYLLANDFLNIYSREELS
jgi:hypothetical protein